MSSHDARICLDATKAVLGVTRFEGKESTVIKQQQTGDADDTFVLSSYASNAYISN